MREFTQEEIEQVMGINSINEAMAEQSVNQMRYRENREGRGVHVAKAKHRKGNNSQRPKPRRKKK